MERIISHKDLELKDVVGCVWLTIRTSGGLLWVRE
jgi:hypothetical protein